MGWKRNIKSTRNSCKPKLHLKSRLIMHFCHQYNLLSLSVFYYFCLSCLPFFCLFFLLPACSSICCRNFSKFVFQSLNLSSFLVSICFKFCMSFLSVHMSFLLFLCLSNLLSVFPLSIFLYCLLSICSSFCLSVLPSVCLSVFPCLAFFPFSVCLFFLLSICPSTCMSVCYSFFFYVIFIVYLAILLYALSFLCQSVIPPVCLLFM